MKNFAHYFQQLISLLLTKTAINTYIVFLGNGVSAFFAFIFTVTAVRTMSLSDFGYFSAILSFMLLVTDLAEMGLGSSMSNFLPPLIKFKTKLFSFLKTAFFLQMIFTLVTISALLFISPLLSVQLFHSNSFIPLIWIGILGILFNLLAQFFQYALSAQQKFFQIAFLSAFSSILRVIFIFLLIIFSMLNLSSITWLHVLTFFITAFTALFFLKADFLTGNVVKSDLVKLLKFTSFLGIARGLTALASRLDVLMLVSLAGPVEAGIYSIASRVISIYPLLAGSFSTVIAPKISTINNKTNLKGFILKVSLGTFAIIFTVFVLIIIAWPFMTTLFGEKAIPAVEVFQILLVSMIFFVASIPVVSMSIYYLHKPQILTINSIIQLIIVIIGNYYFIPKYARLGPAYSLVLAYGITLLTTTLLCFYYYKRKHE